MPNPTPPPYLPAVLALGAELSFDSVTYTVDERPTRENIAAAIRAAVGAERERCAKICETRPLAHDEEWSLQQVAALIREART